MIEPDIEPGIALVPTPHGVRRLALGWLGITTLCLAVFLSRLPVMVRAKELNVDESGLLAQAMRYSNDLMPWRSADGTSSGPLNAWLLLGFHWMGLPLSYRTAHVVAALANSTSILCLYWAARNSFGRHAAFVAAAVAATWLAVNQAPDFDHYSSEVTPILLLSCGLLGCSGPYYANLLGALALGCVPWTKLQAAPIAAVVGVWLVFRAIPQTKSTAARSRSWWAPLAVVACGLLPSILMVIMLASGGVLEDCYRSYFVANLYYAGAMAPAPFLKHVARFFTTADVAPWFLSIAAVCAACPVPNRLCGLCSGVRDTPALGIAVLLATVFACARPEMGFPHYELLFLPPMVLVTAAIVSGMSSPSTRLGTLFLAGLVGFVGGSIGPAFRFDRELFASPRRTVVVDIVVAEMHRVAPAARSVAVWGWMPSIYVETGITPATRHVIFHYLVSDNPSRDFLRETFIRDLATSRPDVIVDVSSAAGKGGVYGEAPLVRMEDFPRLRAIVDSGYTRAVHMDQPLAVDLYLRNSPERIR